MPQTRLFSKARSHIVRCEAGEKCPGNPAWPSSYPVEPGHWGDVARFPRGSCPMYLYKRPLRREAPQQENTEKDRQRGSSGPKRKHGSVASLRRTREVGRQPARRDTTGSWEETDAEAANRCERDFRGHSRDAHPSPELKNTSTSSAPFRPGHPVSAREPGPNSIWGRKQPAEKSLVSPLPQASPAATDLRLPRHGKQSSS